MNDSLFFVIMLVFIGIPILVLWGWTDSRKRKRLATEATLLLSQDLQRLGTNLSLLVLNQEEQEKYSRDTGSRNIIEIHDRPFDYAFADYDSDYNGQYDDEYYTLYFIVKSESQSSGRPFDGISWDYNWSQRQNEWRGDKMLSPILNSDTGLNAVLTREAEKISINQWTAGDGYKIEIRLRQSVGLSSELLGTVESMAQHLNKLNL